MQESNLKKIKVKNLTPEDESIKEVEVLSTYLDDGTSLLIVREIGQQQLHRVYAEQIEEVLESKNVSDTTFSLENMLSHLVKQHSDLEQEQSSEKRSIEQKLQTAQSNAGEMDWEKARIILLNTMADSQHLDAKAREELVDINLRYSKGDRSISLYQKILSLQ